MHEQQPADGGVERLLVDEGTRVALAEFDMAHTQLIAAPLGDRYLRGILFDADHRPVGSDDLGHEKRDIAGSGAEIEDSHPWLDAAALQ
jgi:hypothetical protein